MESFNPLDVENVLEGIFFCIGKDRRIPADNLLISFVLSELKQNPEYERLLKNFIFDKDNYNFSRGVNDTIHTLCQTGRLECSRREYTPNISLIKSFEKKIPKYYYGKCTDYLRILNNLCSDFYKELQEHCKSGY